jgi:SAM-dependent methyltransferase
VKLNDLRDNWDDLGRRDPMWAILADPSRRGNRWSPEEFFATGEDQVAEYLSLITSLGVGLQRERALDFGCGAGRLTQALGRRFRLVDGVDIAPSMIDLAGRYNTEPDRLRFHVNEEANLRLFDDDTFDLVLSVIVLQHMNNDLKTRYLGEFIRVLRPGGIAVFTVPGHARLSASGMLRLLPNRLLNPSRRRRYGYPSVMEFYPMRRPLVEEAIEAFGATLRAVVEDSLAGPPWESWFYIVQKPNE